MNQYKEIKLPKIEDPRGNLSFIEHGASGKCPFEIEKVAWAYDVPSGAEMSLPHSDDSEKELIVAMSGSFDVASAQGALSLNRSDKALYKDGGAASVLDNFSTNSVALVLSSSTAQSSAPAVDGPIDPHPLSDVRLARRVDLPRLRSDNGSITVIENGAEWMPFAVRRVFYLFDVPADAERGGHSHYQARELIVALSGSFDVVLDDGKRKPERFTLNRPYHALYVPTGLWRTLDSFSGGAVCMVLTSERYSEEDYVREYDRFKALTSRK